jgi:hypothetical protein
MNIFQYILTCINIYQYLYIQVPDASDPPYTIEMQLRNYCEYMSACAAYGYGERVGRGGLRHGRGGSGKHGRGGGVQGGLREGVQGCGVGGGGHVLGGVGGALGAGRAGGGLLWLQGGGGVGDSAACDSQQVAYSASLSACTYTHTYMHTNIYTYIHTYV